MMNKSIAKFLVLFTVIMVMSFLIHLILLNLNKLPLFDNKIIGCYLFNYLLAISTYVGLIIFKDKLNNILGFIFMGVSMVKFGLFFIIFYPSFNQDGEINHLEFTSFFIPYTISLIIEVIFLAKTLNK